jgi:tetratricopeptide (TPR) repeat protein
MAMAVMVWSSVPLAMLPLRAGDAPLTLGQPTAPAAEDAAAALFARQFDDALRIVNDSLAALRGSEEGNDKRIRTLLILKGQALYGLGRSQEAIDALAPFAQSLDAAEPLVSAGADWNGLNVLADCFMAVDRWQDALACLSRARSMLAADTSGDGGSQAINSATTLGKIGTAHARLGVRRPRRPRGGHVRAALLGRVQAPPLSRPAAPPQRHAKQPPPEEAAGCARRRTAQRRGAERRCA